MTWNAPPTAALNGTIPYTWWNDYVRDNLNETAVAKATTAGYHFVSTGTNSIAERAIEQTEVATQQTTATTSYVDLATVGPVVTMTTGQRALVFLSAQIGNSGAGQSYASYEVSGASSVPGSDSYSICADGTAGQLYRMGITDLRGTTSGSNTFTMKYRANSGTLTALRRRIGVMGL